MSRIRAAVAVVCLTVVSIGGFAPAAHALPGRDAGGRRSLIGKIFNADATPPGMAGWKKAAGSLVSDIADETDLLVTEYQKGRSRVIVFHSAANGSPRSTILDVIEVKVIPTREEFLIGGCTYHGELSDYHVAIAKQNPTPATMLVRRVWYIDRDRLQFTRLSTTAGFNCDQEQS